MQDFASFSLVGTIDGMPQWIQPKNGGNQTLECRIRVDGQGYNGQPTQDYIQVRFGRASQEAMRNLVPGTRVCVTGTISGRLWTGERGQRVFNDFRASGYTLVAPPPARGMSNGFQPQYAPQPVHQAPSPVVTDEDIYRTQGKSTQEADTIF